MRRLTIDEKYRYALSAAYKRVEWVFLTNYVDGTKSIDYREPCPFTRELMTFYSRDYAKDAGVTTCTARRHLRQLAEEGLIYEERYCHYRDTGGINFRLNDRDSDIIARLHISRLLFLGYDFKKGERKENIIDKLNKIKERSKRLDNDKF